MVRISILMPNYNNAPYLKECIDSIINQTYQNFNVVIVDDGSTDDSINIIEEYQDQRIKVIKKTKNSGIIDTLNIGLKAIDSQYIVRMDGDDIMHPKRLETLINYMDNHPDIGVCGSAIKHFGISEDVIKYPENPLINHANLIFKHSIGHASVIIRNNILQNHNISYSDGYKYMEDYKLFYDLSRVTKMTSIPDVLYFYRREEYNNFKHQDIIKIGLKKMYQNVLAKLEIEPDDTTLNIHYELGRFHNFSFSMYDYKKHLNLLIQQNEQKKIFPHSELKAIIKKLITRLNYRLIDNNKLSIKEAVPFIIKSPKNAYYFIKSKITK
jgi:glycosyltransferase involved in cell wall biosynthesis